MMIEYILGLLTIVLGLLAISRIMLKDYKMN